MLTLIISIIMEEVITTIIIMTTINNSLLTTMTNTTIITIIITFDSGTIERGSLLTKSSKTIDNSTIRPVNSSHTGI